MSFDNLTRSCLYNWLGYGNMAAPVWFIGMEEGGAEIWRHNKMTLEDSLNTRSKYGLAMDFRTVWEDYYQIPLETFVQRRGSLTTWHFMAVFLLSLQGAQPTTQAIRDYVFESKHLGHANADHFMAELLPLPRVSHDSMRGYDTIWSSVKEYKNEVVPQRFELISRTIISNPCVKLLVSYDKSFTAEALSYYPSELIKEWRDGRGKTYVLHQLDLGIGRHISLLATPFFGQGQANYEGLASAAGVVSEILK